MIRLQNLCWFIGLKQSNQCYSLGQWVYFLFQLQLELKDKLILLLSAKKDA